MRILCYILVVLFVTTSAVGQQINPVPDYIFRNSMSVGRNAPTDTSAYFSIGPRFGATRGFMPPMVVDTAAVTGTKRNGLLIYSIQRNSFLYWDSTGSRWSRIAANLDTLLLSTRAWRQKGIDSLASVRIGGSGVTGYIPKFTAARTLDSSQMFQLGGNIGFGTATPSSLYKVDVSGAIRATQANNATVQIQSTQGNAFFQLQDSSSRWQVGGSSNPPYPNGVFYVYDAKNTVNRMAIDHLGRVALGSNAPAGKLDIRQSGIVDIFMVSTTSGTQENTIQSYANNGAIWSNLDIRSNNLKLFTTTIGGTQAERMRIFENGRVGVNTSTDAGYQFDVAGSMRNTTDAYFATSSGRVAIGHTSPTEELHVVANVDARDGIRIANSNTGNSSIASLILNSPNTTWNIDNNRVGGRLSIVNVSNEVITLTTGRNMGLNVSNPLSNTGVAGSVFHIDSPSDTISSIHLTNSHIGSGLNRGMNIESHKSDAVVWNGSNGFMDFGTNNTRRMRIKSDGEVLINTTSDAGAFQLQVNGVAYAADGLRTGNPTGGTAATWKLGTVASVSPTSPNRTIEVDIGGTIYYIHAKTTND